MLQLIHQNAAAPRASSLYCRWIRERRSDRERLVAVWVDSEMRCFERELTGEADTGVLQQDAVDEPGGVLAEHSARPVRICVVPIERP